MVRSDQFLLQADIVSNRRGARAAIEVTTIRARYKQRTSLRCWAYELMSEPPAASQA